MLVLVWPEIEAHLGEARGASLIDGQDASSFLVNPSGLVEPRGEQRIIEPFLEIPVNPQDRLIAALGVALVPSSEASVEISIESNRPFLFHRAERFRRTRMCSSG